MGCGEVWLDIWQLLGLRYEKSYEQQLILVVLARSRCVQPRSGSTRFHLVTRRYSRSEVSLTLHNLEFKLDENGTPSRLSGTIPHPTSLYCPTTPDRAGKLLDLQDRAEQPTELHTMFVLCSSFTDESIAFSLYRNLIAVPVCQARVSIQNGKL